MNMFKISLVLLFTGITMATRAETQAIDTPSLQAMDQINREINIGRIYKHYKGALYKVVAIAVDTEVSVIDDYAKITNAHRRVIYYALDDKDLLWDRPYEMFAEKVIINDIEQYRFAEYDAALDLQK